MFGQNDDNQQTDNQTNQFGGSDNGSTDATVQQPVPGTAPSFPNPTFTPTDMDTVAAEQDSEQPEPQVAEKEASASTPTDEPSSISTAPAPSGDLADMKKEALSKLSPLVSHLDQSPLEKFRTLMMMIQSTDDQALLKEAYETAQKIDDDTEKAKALLAVINEIDYFSKDS